MLSLFSGIDFMNIHFLQNCSFETPGYLNTLINKYGYTSSCTPVYCSTDFPDLNSFELLVILGGPMNVYEEEQFPFLIEEKKFIKNAIDAGKKVLGICLGAQLIATVLGAVVTKNQLKEIGWYPVKLSSNYSEHSLLGILPEEFVVMLWHGDTFGIPSGAQRIASSSACLNQGFIYSDRVIALQFHLETSYETLKEMVKNCSSELVEGQFIQKDAELLSGAEQHMRNANKIMELLFNGLINL